MSSIYHTCTCIIPYFMQNGNRNFIQNYEHSANICGNRRGYSERAIGRVSVEKVISLQKAIIYIAFSCGGRLFDCILRLKFTWDIICLFFTETGKYFCGYRLFSSPALLLKALRFQNGSCIHGKLMLWELFPHWSNQSFTLSAFAFESMWSLCFPLSHLKTQ